METETQKALKLCILDARERKLGVCVYNTAYSALICQIQRDLDRAQELRRELRLCAPPFYFKRYTFCEAETQPRFKHGDVEFIPGSHFAFSSIRVVDIGVYYDSGIGGSGEYSKMTLGGSLLPGPWMVDITEAARVLSEVVAKGEADLAVKKAQDAQDLAKAASFLTSRRSA